jgi:hypothetical protein
MNEFMKYGINALYVPCMGLSKIDLLQEFKLYRNGEVFYY